MKVTCPTCGDSVLFQEQDVGASGHLFFCGSCGQELRAQRSNAVMEVLFSTMSGDRIVDIIPIKGGNVTSADHGGLNRTEASAMLFTLDEGNSDIQLEGDSPNKPDASPAARGSSESPASGPAPSPRPTIGVPSAFDRPRETLEYSDDAIDIDRSTQPSQPTFDPAARAPRPARPAPRQPKEGGPATPPSRQRTQPDDMTDRSRTATIPTISMTHTLPSSATLDISKGDRRFPEAGLRQRAITKQPHRTITASPVSDARPRIPTNADVRTLAPPTPTTAARPRVTSSNTVMPTMMMGEQSDSGGFLSGYRKPVLIGGAAALIVILVAVGVVAIFGKNSSDQVPVKAEPSLQSAPDYARLVDDLRHTYSDVTATPPTLLKDALAALFEDTESGRHKAESLFAQALIQQPGDAETVSGYVIARLWDFEADISLPEIKQLNDGLDFAVALHGPSPTVNRAKTLVHYHLRHWEESRSLADAACGPDGDPTMLCHIIRSLVYLRLEPHRSISEMEKILATPGCPSLAYDLIGQAYLKVGQYATAERYLKKRLELVPDHGGAMLQLAGLYADLARFKDAFTLLDRAAALEQYRVRAAIVAGTITRTWRLDPAPALRILGSLLTEGFGEAHAGQRSRAMVEYALLLHETGSTNEAVAMLRRSSIHRTADYLRTVLSYCAGMYSVSVGNGYQDFKEAVMQIESDYADDPLFRFVAAFALIDSGLPKEGVTALQDLSAFAQNAKVVPITMAMLYLEGLNTSEALRFLERLDHVSALEVLFTPKTSLFTPPSRLWQRTRDALQNEELLMRRRADALRYRALAAFWLERYEESLPLFRDAWDDPVARRWPKNIQLPWAVALVKTGKLKEAEEVAKRLVIMVPGDADARMVLGYIQELRGSPVPAQASYVAAMDRARSDDNAVLLNARLALAKGQIDGDIADRIDAWSKSKRDNLLWRQASYFLGLLRREQEMKGSPQPDNPPEASDEADDSSPNPAP